MEETSTCPHVLSVGDYTQEEIGNKSTQCEICQIVGPNLWICLHKDCDLFIGCGEQGEDHSSQHFHEYPDHCLTLNLTTFRVWCYVCQTEVYLERNDPPLPKLPTDTQAIKEHLSKKAILSNSVFIANDGSSSSDDELSADEAGNLIPSKSRSRPKGLTGLQNLGNTCYMNAALQALSHCPQLTRFMLDCAPFVRKPGLSKSYMRLMNEIWNPKRPSYVVPTGIAHGIKTVCPVFKGYTQHDAQEFLRCFLDQLHEELKEPVFEENSETYEHQGNLSDEESSSDGDYETCDSGLSSEPSAFGDELNGHNVLPKVVSDLAMEGGRTPTPEADSARSSSPSTHHRKNSATKRKPVSYRSVIADVFDGKLLSSVQCLTCDNVSTTKETFQDLSLPIPSREQLTVLRAAQGNENSPSSSPANSPVPSPQPMSRTSSTLSLSNSPVKVYHWFWDWIEYLFGFFWGPTVTLQDCLSAFFSADELKGDNMYSCDKCKKLRNGIKYSKVVQLPDTLCIHLKRFRHELMYSSKISSQVTFPLEGLDMSPYIVSNDCSGQVTTYDLIAAICHHGTPASGHYTAYCLNTFNQTWYEFDDQYVTAVDPHQVSSCEAYVLFYRKSSEACLRSRQKALELMKISRNEPTLLRFYISKQWINKFNTYLPGPVSNNDFLCEHGSVHPDKAGYVHELCTVISRSVWEYLYSHFGGGPVCTKLYVCRSCSFEKEQLDRRRRHEYDTFARLNCLFTKQRVPTAVYSIAMSWYKHWEAFVTRKTDEAPGQIDNSSIAMTHPRTGQTIVRVGSDHATISAEIWHFLHGIYGGGPTVGQVNRRTNSSQSLSYSSQDKFGQGGDEKRPRSSSDFHEARHQEPHSTEKLLKPSVKTPSLPRTPVSDPHENAASLLIDLPEPMDEDGQMHDGYQEEASQLEVCMSDENDRDDEEVNNDALSL